MKCQHNLSNFSTGLASLGEELTKEEVQELIIEADTDGDGQIDYAEFAKLMMAL